MCPIALAFLCCQISGTDHITIVLADVHSGVGYPLAHLPDLPGLIQQLLLRRPEAPNDVAPKQAG